MEIERLLESVRAKSTQGHAKGSEDGAGSGVNTHGKEVRRFRG